MVRGLWRAGVLAVLCATGWQAHAHDSWLSPSRHDSPGGPAVLELSTGNRYPVQEFSQTPESVVRSQCIDGKGRATSLRPLKVHPQWLDLVSGSRHPLLSCWVELDAAEIADLEPGLVNVYFAEIRASAFHRETWAALQARKLPWRESYRKFARIELPSAATPAQLASARRPAGLDLEIVIVGDQPFAVGQPISFQVLRDGKPLPQFPVELVSERSPLGIWRQTDAQGMLQHTLPFAGRWLLRGTDLRLSAARPDTWQSRFVTLAFEMR
jgi:uncharacterized GH25 family protein